MHAESMVLDAAGTVFFQGQLTAVQSRVYSRKFPAALALVMLPVMVEGPAHAKWVEYETEVQTGQSGFIADQAEGGPAVGVAGDRVRSPTFEHGNHYSYSDPEIVAAMASRQNLADRKAMSSKRAHDMMTDQLAWLGDNTVGATGFLNHPDVPRTAASDTLANLVASSPDDALAELNDWVNGINDLTNDTLGGKLRIGMPTAQYDLLASTRLSTASDTTILDYWKEHNPYVGDVFKLPRLSGQGFGGTDVAIAFVPDLDHLSLHLMHGYEALPPQRKGFEQTIHTKGKFGAVEIYHPYEAGVLEGI